MKKMRVICSLLLCTAMAVSMFGCSDGDSKKKTDKDDDKKSEKVEDEEEDDDKDKDDKSESKNKDKDSGKSGDEDEGNPVDPIDDEVVGDETGGTVASNDYDSNYSFEGMDSKEIFELVTSFSHMKNGLTLDEIVANYDYEPTRIFNHCISFNTDEYNNWFDIPDCMINVNYACEVDDNGVWVYPEGESYVFIEFHVSDEKIAKEVFRLLYSEIESSLVVDRVSDNSDEDNVDWTVNFFAEGEEQSGHYIWMMKHPTVGYHFYVCMPVTAE